MTRRVPYPMRSLLFVPGHNRRYLESAVGSGADVLVPDLEDSVPPGSKQQAREVTREAVVNEVISGHIFPRVNSLDSGHLLKDIEALAVLGVSGFMYPKAERGRDFVAFADLLHKVEKDRHLPLYHFKIIPLIETASAVLHVQEICETSVRVVAVAFGCEDFVADLHGEHDLEHQVLEVPRALIAMGARAANVIPIDTVHVRVHDLDDLERGASHARMLGFEGMLALHPKEIPVIHECFTPDVHQVEEAEEILRLSVEAEELGKGVAMLHGKFIGPPLVRAAQHTLELAGAIERRDK